MKELLIAIAAYLSVGYINEFTAENQVYHDIKNPPLFDRGHQLFPTIDQKYPNYLLIALISYFVLRWGVQYPRTAINYLWMISFLFAGRVLVLTVTQLPPPLPGCSTVAKGDSLHFRVLKKTWTECMDLMYSGHAIHTVLIFMFVLYLSPYKLEKLALGIITLVELCCIIASRLHYTADVLVASIVSVLTFVSWTDINTIVHHWYHGGTYGRMLLKTLN
jgi:hypothetical protein